MPDFKRRALLTLGPAWWLFPLSSFAQSRDIAAAVVGQSNEQGTGVRPSNKIENFFLQDPVPPNGGPQSWWPQLAYAIFQRTGRKLLLRNTAVGATSLCDSWVGRIRNWTKGMNVVRGSYVLYAGNLFKCTIELGKATTSLTPPLLSMVGQPLADSCVWENIRQNGLSAGAISANQSELFDPNGLLKRTKEEVLAVKVVSDRWVFISIGQTDRTVGATRQNYADALISTTNYFLTAKIKVLLGFTCYGARPGLDDWFTKELIPGWRDALSAFSGNQNVIAGANLREKLGVLPVGTTELTPGLATDELHLNTAAYRLAAEAWFESLIQARLI